MLKDDHSKVYALIKPTLDAHTLGVNSAAELLKECGFKVVIASELLSNALEQSISDDNDGFLVHWLQENKITHLGFSYRLDPHDGVRTFGRLMDLLKSHQQFTGQGGTIESVFYAGLPEGAKLIDEAYQNSVQTFVGGESAKESLLKMGVPEMLIASHIIEESYYDSALLEFGKKIITEQSYKQFKPIKNDAYDDYGTEKDSIVKRLQHHSKGHSLPLIRAHVGPYDAMKDRQASVDEFIQWAKTLAETGYLDILSIGSSQLTQSNFGEEWGSKTNGGGVPVNSTEEYRRIYEVSRPMFVRTYAGTKQIPELARMHENTLNICWHALSFWWFNQLDSRGPYDLLTNLHQHVDTLKVIAESGKPFEPNVPHHFAFRGADDVTFIVSAYLAAKLAQCMGISTLILQIMLNTPRSTWGIQDLAKSRALLKLVRKLESPNFSVLLQTRAGLDYLKISTEEAKIQLAAVTALMDDIECDDETSPQIIHVVSYSEASHLATPEIINESIQITQFALQEYRNLKKLGAVADMSFSSEVKRREVALFEAANVIIDGIESSISDPYSAEGFYTIFAAGFLPVPYLWHHPESLKHAVKWQSCLRDGGVVLIDDCGERVSPERVVAYAQKNVSDIIDQLNEQRGVSND